VKKIYMDTPNYRELLRHGSLLTFWRFTNWIIIIIIIIMLLMYVPVFGHPMTL